MNGRMRDGPRCCEHELAGPLHKKAASGLDLRDCSPTHMRLMRVR